MRRFGIRSRLFLSYTLVVSFVIATLSIFFYNRMSSSLYERSLESSQQMLQRVDAALTQTIRDLDRISAQVIYNTSFQYRFHEPFDSPNSYEALDQKREFETILSTLNGPSFIAEQINVFNLDGDFISYGLKIDPYPDLKERILLTDWIAPTQAKEGEKVLNPPHVDKWFRSGELIFSLSRLFPNNSAVSPQFVEVQQRYEKLEEIVGDTLRQMKHRVYIFDDQGRLFYPVNNASPPPFSWDDLPDLPTGAYHHMTKASEGESYMLGWLRSPLYNMTVVDAQPESVLLSPVKSLRTVVLTVTVAAEILALLVAYFFAATITRPLLLILREIKRLDLDHIHRGRSGLKPKTYEQASYEIKELYDGIVLMKNRLNHSLEQLLESQNRENHAHMRALHAQLQPHFMFNTLSSVGVLAEQAGADKAAEMCYRLMKMMEYISRPPSEPVELSEEIRFTEDYLELMKLRYQDYFSYEANVDESLGKLLFPKFVLQPIVENSFAHGFKDVYPPWHIGILIHAAEKGRWEIRIRDNGSGFRQDALAHFQGFIEELNSGGFVKSEQIARKGIGGLGLENALMRLYLFFDGEVSFSIRNLEEGMELAIAVGRKEQPHV